MKLLEEKQEVSLFKRIWIFFVFMLKQPYRETKNFFISIYMFFIETFNKLKNMDDSVYFWRKPRAVVYFLVVFLFFNFGIAIIKGQKMKLISWLFGFLILALIWKEWKAGKYMEEYRKKIIS